MSNKCDICGRTPQFGHSISHSKIHTNRPWGLNVHKQTVHVEGLAIRLNVCSRCLRTQQKQSKAVKVLTNQG